MIENLINNITNLKLTSSGLQNKKSSIFIIILIIIKTLYGCCLIFDIITTLFTVIIFLHISDDIDKNNNIIQNKSIINNTILGVITYIIGNTSLIKKNQNIPNILSNFFKTSINMLTSPQINTPYIQ